MPEFFSHELNDQITKDMFGDVENVTYQTYFLYDDNGNFTEGKVIASNEEVPKNATTKEPTKKLGNLVAMMVKPVFRDGVWIESAKENETVDGETSTRIALVKQVADLQLAVKQQSLINANLTKQIADLKLKGSENNG